MIKTFINRPVLATVISMFIVLLGVLGYIALPVTQYPDIAPPTIRVSASYAGADAATVMRSVIVPIEEQINGVENMDYITSTADNNGSATITVYFRQGTDPDMAAVNVQNRVARATSSLPSEVTKVGVVTSKQQTSALMFLSFYSENPDYDATFIQNYININVVPAIKRIKGVGNASAFGGMDYSMRIWISPKKLKAYNLTPAMVIAAIGDQSQQATPGTLGQNTGGAFQYTIKYDGKYSDVEQYENIIVKTGTNGQLLHLKDIARIELGSISYSTLGKSDGFPSIPLAVYQTAGSNAQTIIEEIHKLLKESAKDFPKGLNYGIDYDTNEFLTATMSEVLITFIEALLLVFLVVFVFLQDLRSTLIPAIAVPVSIVGTFFVLNLLGYSVNMLTLFALILAIGIVVDDAIVVVEAVHAKIEGAGSNKNMKEITAKAMSGISTAIISITLVMASVFIPVTFISGTTGVFYKQFGITLMIAIIISAVNALTLSPMLCALFIKPKNKEQEKKKLLHRFYEAFNLSFTYMTKRYLNVVRFIIRRRWIAFILIIAALAGIYYTNETMPSGFVPNEDRKIMLLNLELPPGSSMERTAECLETFYQKASKIKGIKSITYVAGVSIINGMGSNNGLGFIKLTDWEDRDIINGEETVDAILKKLSNVAATLPEGRFMLFNMPSVPGYGLSAGFNFQILDKTGGDLKTFDNNTKTFLYKLMSDPSVMFAQTGFNTNYPQYKMEINVPVAQKAGVSSSQIFTAMAGYIGGIYIDNFNKFGKQYWVVMQAEPDSRIEKADVDNIFVSNAAGKMIPVSQFITLKRVYGPQNVSRFNLFTSASVTAMVNPGYSTGEGIAAMQKLAKTQLPQGYDIDYSGITREEINSSSTVIMIFALSLIFVFLLLSAQYESFLLPWAIILSLPLGIMGAFVSQKLAGLENNIYFQIALIMLVGLLAKNAILIVEFALQKRKLGFSIARSAIMGAQERLRPILMTSFAFIMGLLPLVTASSVGAIGNRSLATGAAFGLLVGTFLGLLVIPTMFAIFQFFQEKVKPMQFSKTEEAVNHI